MSKFLGKFMSKGINISFPFNINEIINNRKIDLEFFKNNPCIKEVYTTPFFINSKIKDMNGVIPDFNKELALEILYKIKDLGVEICVILNNPNYDYSKEISELLSFNDLISWLCVCDDKLLKYNYIFKIKNSVVKQVHLNNYKDYLKYDMIYFHDDIIHNHDKFINIPCKKGCVVNFSECLTYCNLKTAHYQAFTQGEYDFDQKYCPCHKMSDLELFLKRCSIPRDFYEYLYYSDVIDTFKLQGRTQTEIFDDAIKIVQGITNKKMNFKNPLSQFDYYKWKVHVRNCSGSCLNCTFCDEICKKYEKREEYSFNFLK